MDELKPAYLVLGTDKLKRKIVLERLAKKLANPQSFDAENTDTNEIINCCNTVPFFEDKRYVLVTNAEKLNSDATVEYLQNPCKTTVLCLVCNKLAKNSKILKAIDATCIINCEQPKKYQLADTITQNFNIEKSAAKALIDLVGEDTLLIESQINKILIANENKTITEQDIRNHVNRSAKAMPWDFTNAFADKNLTTALSAFNSMEQGSEYSLLPMTCNRVKELIGTKIVGEQNLGLPQWQVRNHRAWARNFTMEELKEILNKALTCEEKMKSTSNSKLAFETFVIEALKG